MAKHRPRHLLITCEHAGNRVPAKYAPLFVKHAALLASHRGWDPGALPLARVLARAFDTPMLHHDVTRLLVESNRSLHHPALFSAVTRDLPEDDRRRIVDEHYLPHRRAVEAAVCDAIAGGACVVHIGVHSFTPSLNGVTRNADVGLLYDPTRRAERAICHAWRDAIRQEAPQLRVRMNYPYRGIADGLTTALRRVHPANAYLGIELEMNQGLLLTDARGTPHFPADVSHAIVDSLRTALSAR
ncbi:MAG: N-formylglutamate amidohydrolase [Phycisphaera sp.]|nr:N-formylglutamate amidohydrolase [Phycisphaera sp.]